MWYFLYNLLLVVASPIILGILLTKQRCRQGLSQRLGCEKGLSGLFGAPEPNKPGKPKKPDQPLIWVHAVSLGEVVAVTPLVTELHRRHPDYRFIVSTFTETGREAVEQRLATIAEHRYAPLDFPWVVETLVRRWQPRLYIFVETEFWPNLLRTMRRHCVPTVLVNGRLSTRSYARQQWILVRSFYRAMLRKVSLFLMQSDRDVERVVLLGADPRSVRRTGNIKFDQPMPGPSGSGISRSDLGVEAHEQLFVAGSTHPGEEEAIVAAYRLIVTACPSAVLLLAPRHIERAEQVEAMLRAQGVAVQRRSAVHKNGGVSGSGPRVVILDTRGELASVYREAAVAFVGGTLVPIGGHNLLEPAVWAKPVLFGPNTDNCAEIADLLSQGGGGMRVTDAEALARQVIRVLKNPADAMRMGQLAQQVIRQNQGALQRTLEAIETLLVQDPANVGSSSERRAVPLMVGR
jgi:3-deoxy-D-manno-octulosonic-acid transferase